jgi:hypothetical protein
MSRAIYAVELEGQIHEELYEAFDQNSADLVEYAPPSMTKDQVCIEVSPEGAKALSNQGYTIRRHIG